MSARSRIEEMVFLCKEVAAPIYIYIYMSVCVHVCVCYTALKWVTNGKYCKLPEACKLK